MDRRDRMAQYGGLPSGVTFHPAEMTFTHGEKAETSTLCPYAGNSGLVPCGECQFCLDEEHGAYFSLPAKYEVCGTCNGKGTHVNPSIDAHGITGEEWENEWSDEDREGYFSGRYDVTCSECDGKRVVPVPDESRATKEAMAAWEEISEDDADYRNLCEAEHRMGC